MKRIALCALLALLSFFLALPVTAQPGFGVNPNMGATLLLKDGKTYSVGEILADASYSFPYSDNPEGRGWGELVGLIGLGDQGNTLLGMGYRSYLRQGSVYPGFGLQFLVVDKSTAPDVISETSLAVAGELLLEIPWAEEYVSDEGSLVVKESMVAGYAGFYGPVYGDKDFFLVRFGIRAGI